MMIALPNPDRSFTCTLFWPTGSFDALAGDAAIEAHFRSQYPDLLPLAPSLVDDYQHNPVGLLGTVHTAPWQAHGRTALVGDAAHAIVPFYGQGANCAFEDVVELDRCLDDTAGTWARALPLFEHRRRENTEAIAEMALANFVEMRDKVASPVFRLGKRIEHTLERTFPGRYVSRYELVSFSTTPYAEVRARVHRQHQVLAAAVLLGAGVLGAAARIARASGSGSANSPSASARPGRRHR
jgi:kynurenine 3-monooxygenase